MRAWSTHPSHFASALRQRLRPTLRACGLAALWAAGTAGAAPPLPSAPLPIESVPLHVDAMRPDGGRTRWTIGPLHLSLPSTWRDSSRVSVSLQGPGGSAAAFVLARANPEWLSRGYLALAEENFDAQLLSIEMWGECRRPPTQVQALATPPLARGLRVLKVGCVLAASPEQRGQPPHHMVQVALLSSTQLMQILVGGPKAAVEEFLAALPALEWREPEAAAGVPAVVSGAASAAR